MIHQETLDRFKEKDLKKSFGFVQGLSNLGSEKFVNLSQKSGIDPASPYTGESYDAAALVILSNFAKIYSKENTINNLIFHVVFNYF